MLHQSFIFFFLQMSAMVTVALACRQVMFRLRQPVVVGELFGGIVLGPTVLGTLIPGMYAWLFPTAQTTTVGLEAVLTLGMVFFLFVAGLEVNVEHLQGRGLSMLFTSLLGIIVPFILGASLVLLLPDLWGPEAKHRTAMFALFIGTALSISALPVIAKTLMDLDLLHKELGSIVMTSAMVNDLIGWSLFAVMLSHFVLNGVPDRNLWVTLGLVVGFAAFILIVGRWGSQRMLGWLRAHVNAPGSFIAMTTILVLAAAASAEAIGIHAIFGAFLVGVALAQGSKEWNQDYKVFHQLAVNFFAPLYFVSLGLKVNFITHFDLPLVLLVLFVACVGKIGGAGLGAWMGGLSPREALAVGFGMNARGAMEMILASVALEYKLIDHRIFVALVVMALVTSMLSGPVMRRLLRLGDDEVPGW